MREKCYKIFQKRIKFPLKQKTGIGRFFVLLSELFAENPDKIEYLIRCPLGKSNPQPTAPQAGALSN